MPDPQSKSQPPEPKPPLSQAPRGVPENGAGHVPTPSVPPPPVADEAAKDIPYRQPAPVQQLAPVERIVITEIQETRAAVQRLDATATAINYLLVAAIVGACAYLYFKNGGTVATAMGSST